MSIGGTVGSILGQLALGVLKDLLARQDIHDAEKLKLVEEVAKLNVDCETWKAEAMRDPARAARLGLRGTPEGIRSVRLDDPPPPAAKGRDL